MKTQILLKNNLIEIPSGKEGAPSSLVGTVFSNLSYYGFVLSKEACSNLLKLTPSQIKSWWAENESALKEITGDNKNMGEFVVYKNFPAEVLEKTEAEYWIAQVLMYIGCPNDWFTQPSVARDLMLEKQNLKVLHLANTKSLQNIYSSLIGLPNRLTKEQLQHVLFLYQTENIKFDATKIPFKENLIKIIVSLIDVGAKIKISSAMDVLRLGVGISGGDVSFVEKSKFKSFSRKHRQFLLKLLENSSNLEEDTARDKEKWKKFLRNLHPNDYRKQYPSVCKVYDKLYNDDVNSFNSKVETLLLSKNKQVLKLLQSRPGDFTRRLNKIIEVFGKNGCEAYNKVVSKLTTIQLLKIQKYLTTVNKREKLTIAPKGNWTKLKILENENEIKPAYINLINNKINLTLKKRLNFKFVKGINLSKDTDLIKIQTNDSDLSPYGRGTTFPIPDNVNFLRSASYWSCKRGHNTWFDNGWNLFDSDWKSVGSCCWTATNFNGAAVFSGDPTNSKTSDGKACQMIDLYIDKLLANGVRYAVWNILCYSRIKFNQAEDVFAALQWGEEAQKGKLFEPSRCQLSFPLKGDSFTKYVAYIDLKERKLVYIDANLKSSTRAASSNSKTLENQMPAFVEYLNTLPSVYNLFSNAKKNKKGTVIAYTDENLSIKNKKSYVFKPSNKENKFEQINIAEILK